MNLVLIYFALKYWGDFDKIYKALKDNKSVSQEKLDDIKSNLRTGKHLLISHTSAGLSNSTKRILETNKIASVLSDKLWVFSSDENNYVMRLVKEFKKLKKTIFCFQDGKGELGNKRFLNKNSNLIEEITFTKIED